MREVYHRGDRNLEGSSAVMLAYAHLLWRRHVTANDFRRLALSLPEAEERAHMDHPDFRVGGKIFATLGYPDKSHGMVKLSREQQHYLSKDYPDVFVPVKGAWGRRGATSVHLKAADKAALRKAISEAWRNTAPKRIAKQLPEEA
jgi:hypothetical protein